MRTILAAITLVAVAACGGPPLGEPMAATSSQTMAATQANGSVDQLSGLRMKPDGAFALYSTMAALGPMAVDFSVKKTSALFTQGLDPQDLPAGCVTGDAGSGFTYNNCTVSGTSINGTIKNSGGTTDIDLQIKASGQGAMVNLSLVGSVTNTDTAVSGKLVYELKVDLGISLPGVNAANQKTTIQYDIGYSGKPACISSGTLRIDYEAGGTSGAAQFEYTGCGMYKVRNG